MLTKAQLDDAKAQFLIQKELALDLLEKLDEIYLMKKGAVCGKEKTEYLLLAATNNVRGSVEQELKSVNHELERINEYSRAHFPDLGKKRRRTQRTQRKKY